MTVAAALAGRSRDEPAVLAGGRRWTAGQLHDEVRRAAVQLPGRPVGPLAVVLTDPVAQLIWALAADTVGRTVAMLDPRWPVAARDAALAVVRPGVVVGPAGPVVAAGGGVTGRGWITFTSGSTGPPRALWRDPDSWAGSFPAVGELIGLLPGDRVLVPGSLSSSLCAFAAVHTVAARGCAVLVTRWSTAASRYPAGQVDVAHLVPAMLTDLLTDRSTAAAPPRVAVVGGAALDPALEERTRRCWPAVRLVTYYGSSEQSFVTARVAGGPERPGTAGRAFSGVTITVRDDSLRPLPAGTAGTIWTTGPWHARPLVPSLPTPYPAEASLATSGGGDPGPGRRGATVGDRGVLDGRGVLTVLGRDHVVTGGNTVEPGVVEATLRECPGVDDAVVFGLPHPRLGEVVAAAVDADGVTLAALRAHVLERLAPAQRPRRWWLASPLPRGSLGKPARAEIAAAARAGRLPRLS